MKYRKRPVVIDAWEFRDAARSPAWIDAAMDSGTVWYQGGDAPYFTIKTLEGDHRANLGDWIIKGIQGELYPCKPDIFAATYELVE